MRHVLLIFCAIFTVEALLNTGLQLKIDELFDTPGKLSINVENTGKFKATLTTGLCLFVHRSFGSIIVMFQMF
ncbi:hypothetical protein CAEBREN_28464 [Caenorhabditis brenneri]|uniref:Uncharacterized protein n=1 Tax=Caenorhabditis brenneri TaxID=135651 RepID=G0PB50_CAEBE|nr:hypothetical protein CAEBREN_28464 [Caenorhabditis brenneri]